MMRKTLKKLVTGSARTGVRSSAGVTKGVISKIAVAGMKTGERMRGGKQFTLQRMRRR
jgi:hypothetical protein